MLVKRAGAKVSYDSFVKTYSFIVKPKEVEKPKETLDNGIKQGSKEDNNLQNTTNETKPQEENTQNNIPQNPATETPAAPVVPTVPSSNGTQQEPKLEVLATGLNLSTGQLEFSKSGSSYSLDLSGLNQEVRIENVYIKVSKDANLTLTILGSPKTFNLKANETKAISLTDFGGIDNGNDGVSLQTLRIFNSLEIGITIDDGVPAEKITTTLNIKLK